MHVLTFTSLFPNNVRPRHGIFVETRLRHFLELGGSDIRVVAPVPHFPLAGYFRSTYADLEGVDEIETRRGIEVRHPRALIPPLGGMYTAPGGLYRAGLAEVRRMQRQGWDSDLIDAHYMYPDGVAAVRLGRVLGKPVVVTVRGTDINLLPGLTFPRPRILDAIAGAAHIIAVSRALKERLLVLGAPADKVTVLRNGVDTDIFRDVGAGENVARLVPAGVGPLILAVGNLVPEKGMELIVEAVARMDDARLLVVGSGPEEATLRRLIKARTLGGRARIVPELPQEILAALFAAADLFMLASSREGSPNVVLEALACGTPVVASRIAATEELLTGFAGAALAVRTPNALAEAALDLLAAAPSRGSVRKFARQFDWKKTAEGQMKVFRKVLAEGGRTA